MTPPKKVPTPATNRETPFRSRLYKQGVNRVVDIPAEISKSLGGGGYIPIEGWIAGVPIRSTLIPGGGGRHRLFVHSRIWKSQKIERGDFVEILLSRAEPLAEPPVPEDIALALNMTKGAAAAFRQITPALRREFINWVEAAKQSETRARRIQKALPILVERARNRTPRLAGSARR